MSCVFVNLYHGTNGNAGLYLESMLEAMAANTDVDVVAIANYHYLFSRAPRIKNCLCCFFPLTDGWLGRVMNRKVRLIVRFFELIFGYIFSFAYLCKLKLRYTRIVINYSLIERFSISYFFLFIVRRLLKAYIIVTVHDAKPFIVNVPSALLISHESFLKFADRLLCHTRSSMEYLTREFGVGDKLLYCRFPLMNLSKLSALSSDRGVAETFSKPVFLFLGFIRKEKGIECLLDAWCQSKAYEDGCTLVVAGALSTQLEEMHMSILRERCIFINKRLSDAEYKELLLASDYVVLPYTSGTNSGVLSTAASLKKLVICSDLPMFLESLFIESKLIFKRGDVAALTSALNESLSIFRDGRYADIIGRLNERLVDYENGFFAEVGNVMKNRFFYEDIGENGCLTTKHYL